MIEGDQVLDSLCSTSLATLKVVPLGLGQDQTQEYTNKSVKDSAKFDNIDDIQ
jgi:hypothetical protein